MIAISTPNGKPLLGSSGSPRYPLIKHIVGLLPLVALIATMFLMFESEDDIARYFSHVKLRFPDMTEMVKWLTKFCNAPFYVVYAGLVLSAYKPERRNGGRFVLRYLFLLALLLLVSDTLKIWIGRPRPDQAGEYIMFSLRKVQHSFPSNHMTESAFNFLSLALYCRRPSTTIACSLGITVMGMTRLYLGRHYPTDLLGSVALGSLWAYFLWKWQFASVRSTSNYIATPAL